MSSEYPPITVDQMRALADAADSRIGTAVLTAAAELMRAVQASRESDIIIIIIRILQRRPWLMRRAAEAVEAGRSEDDLRGMIVEAVREEVLHTGETGALSDDGEESDD